MANAGAEGRLAIIAGEGNLPRHVADAARAAGADPYIIALSNESDQDWSGFDTTTIGVGDMAGLARIFKSERIARVVMSGGVRRRPAFDQIHANLRFFYKLPFVLRTLMAGGDDAVLKMVIGLIEGQGATVIGAHEIAPDLLATVGPLGAVSPSKDDRRDIDRACEAAEALGRLDIGQGAVSVGGRVVALEGSEGTDSMLERVATLRAEGRISQKRKGVLVKLCKPQQDLRADLPTIGRSTVENAARAGLAGVVIEAGRSLVVERAALAETADRLGLFVCGIDTGLPGGGL